MKKTICKVVAFLTVSAICIALSACGGKGNISTENTLDKVENALGETGADFKTYTYKVSPMQGVESCVYYGPNDYVPNSSNSEAARNKIHVWTICPTCCKEGDHVVIPVDELDFSVGNTIQFSDACECYACYKDRHIPSFMWTIKITRVPEKSNK